MYLCVLWGKLDVVPIYASRYLSLPCKECNEILFLTTDSSSTLKIKFFCFFVIEEFYKTEKAVKFSKSVFFLWEWEWVQTFSKKHLSFSFRSLFGKFINLGSICFVDSLRTLVVLDPESGCRIFALNRSVSWCLRLLLLRFRLSSSWGNVSSCLNIFHSS